MEDFTHGKVDFRFLNYKKDVVENNFAILIRKIIFQSNIYLDRKRKDIKKGFRIFK